jgi:hypothetical protein
MAGAFARAAAVLAADPNLGVAALYTPAGEAPLAFRVVRMREENVLLGVGRGIAGGGEAVMIPVLSLPDRPQLGERISIGTEDFLIETAERDEAGASWRVTLREA